MRFFTASMLGLAVALPLGLATVSARADTDNLLDRAQTLFQNHDNDRNAYERGRQDEWQRNHARRDDDNRYNQARRDNWNNGDRFDRDRWHRDHDQQLGYNGNRDYDGDRNDWRR